MLRVPKNTSIPTKFFQALTSTVFIMCLKSPKNVTLSTMRALGCSASDQSNPESNAIQLPVSIKPEDIRGIDLTYVGWEATSTIGNELQEDTITRSKVAETQPGG
jgi:hypothetical protein